MRFIVKLPKVGDSADQVAIVDVLVAPGAVVADGDPLVEVETDKTTVIVPSPVGGEVIEVLVKVDDEVAVGTPVAVITATKEPAG
ncbi:biotin/lipoyl-containing protein [Kribbella sp. NPDC050124]|uniref:biotin/lipoyl-containing protein n=1 Tax=Kribbella sp. NPDC050124 TaxID=3364114 RepID=UPI003796635D